jgi:ubiquinone/menaquinone biosynthesis C-methylase UbiE
MHLEPTGERMITEAYHSTAADHLIYLMHIASYEFAMQFTAGKSVLDYGCGSGYGADKIADSAKTITAVDVAADAIEYARSHFNKPNLDFRCVLPNANLPFGDKSFEVVLSFQVFEHVTATALYLQEIKRVLSPGGVLVLITPDRTERLLPMQKPWNRWHVVEYSPTGLRKILLQHFSDVDLYGMGTRNDAVQIELRRYRKVKWLTLPGTLPFVPEALRIRFLNLIHALYGRRGIAATSGDYPFGIGDIEISKTASPSVNIVSVCRR